MHARDILGPFFPFSGPFSPHILGEAKIHFSAIFVLISCRRPEMDLYQVDGIEEEISEAFAHERTKVNAGH